MFFVEKKFLVFEDAEKREREKVLVLNEIERLEIELNLKRILEPNRKGKDND